MSVPKQYNISGFSNTNTAAMTSSKLKLFGFTHISPASCCMNGLPAILIHNFYISIILEQELQHLHIGIGCSNMQLKIEYSKITFDGTMWSLNISCRNKKILSWWSAARRQIYCWIFNFQWITNLSVHVCSFVSYIIYLVIVWKLIEQLTI